MLQIIHHFLGHLPEIKLIVRKMIDKESLPYIYIAVVLSPTRSEVTIF